MMIFVVCRLNFYCDYSYVFSTRKNIILEYEISENLLINEITDFEPDS